MLIIYHRAVKIICLGQLGQLLELLRAFARTFKIICLGQLGQLLELLRACARAFLIIFIKTKYNCAPDANLHENETCSIFEKSSTQCSLGSDNLKRYFKCPFLNERITMFHQCKKNITSGSFKKTGITSDRNTVSNCHLLKRNRAELFSMMVSI